MLWNDCEAAVREVWGKDGDSTYGLVSVKEKIKTCGAELMKWGSIRTDLDATTIKDIQKRLDRLHEVETREDSKAKYLDLSKRMDELLQKQEI